MPADQSRVDAAARVRHGLSAGGAQVQDREAEVAQAGRPGRVEVDPPVVRAAVGDGRVHPGEEGGGRRTEVAHESVDSTHDLKFPPGGGADLSATNILGMTPMELSVDLGRNDISFMLLSMRGDDGGRRPKSGSQPAPVAEAAKKPVKTAAAKTAPSKQVAAKTAPAKQVAAKTADKTAAAPKLFAGDGGTPLPSAGFLGFDARQASN